MVQKLFIPFFSQGKQIGYPQGISGYTRLTCINCHPKAFWGRSFYGPNAHPVT